MGSEENVVRFVIGVFVSLGNTFNKKKTSNTFMVNKYY
jgi:hypothetical protein